MKTIENHERVPAVLWWACAVTTAGWVALVWLLFSSYAIR